MSWGHAIRLLVLTLILAVTGLQPVQGQFVDPRVQENEEAASLFDSALETFNQGAYADAAAQFSRVTQGFALHTLTTAAALMEVKALYRAGAFQRAAGASADFLERYPSSRYVAEAQRTRRLALEAFDATANRPVTVGIILSLSADEASATQELFNGFRLAVDAHNGRPDVRPVRMVFRNIDELGPAGALASAVEAGASTVFGALFSDQATDAAAAAEELGVVFVAPLATDARVTTDRTMTFQANPSIEMRGRLMARFAVNGLRLMELGVVSEGSTEGISVLMGRAFAEEARALGANVRFSRVLPGARAWFDIGSHVSADSVRSVEAIYAPLSGSSTDQLAGAFLEGLSDMLTSDEQRRLRVLGNSEWHDLPMRTEASRFGVTYSNDFYFDRTTDAAQALTRRFRNLSGFSPGRLGVVGYDLGRYLIETASSHSAEEVRSRLLGAAPYEGLGVRVYFGGAQINRQMYYHRYRDGRLELMR